jgi:hypothetical protein
MEDTPLDGLSSLVRLAGHNVPARARFIGEALMTSTLTSLTLGLSCGMVGASFLSAGPLIPFLFGSWTGYTLGLVNHWRISTMRANKFARQYPSLMAHALMIERGIVVPRNVVRVSEGFLQRDNDDHDVENDEEAVETTAVAISTKPAGGDTTTLEEWIHQGGLGRVTWSVLAAQSCVPDVEDLQRQQRQKLMDEHQEKYRCE